ncbi:MAG: heavy metal sensor histidine kinase [Nitrospirae bacterium]|nr:heavy metal sensor histidine kinase [Nitrospirota bacterium]
MFLKSIRIKIILYYMLILALTLAGFSTLLYQNFSQIMIQYKDNLIQSRMIGIVIAMDAYWEAERLNTEASEKTIDDTLANYNFTKIAQKLVEEKSDDVDLINMVVQIFDMNGTLIASSRHFPTIRVLSDEAIASNLLKERRFSTVRIEISPGAPISARVLTMPIMKNNRVAYVAQIASPIITIRAALSNLRLLLFLLLPLTVILTGIIGVFLAKVALRPVDKMIDTIHQITAENLKLKINIPDTNDEIKRLAETFNAMLERLELTFSSQRQFIEDFAHELKTPLSVLKGELEVTLKRIRSTEEYESILHSNLEEVNRISKIVEDLLILAQFENKEIILEKYPLDICYMIKEIVKDMRTLALQRGVTINVSASGSLSVYGDESRLRRLFINLIENAIKYSSVKSKVNINVEDANEYVRISVSDTGIGIPENEIHNIFNRFYRIDKSRHQPGFGLGLSISKSIVEAHKGTIEVKSKPNHGTTFTVLLPSTHHQSII